MPHTQEIYTSSQSTSAGKVSEKSEPSRAAEEAACRNWQVLKWLKTEFPYERPSNPTPRYTPRDVKTCTCMFTVYYSSEAKRGTNPNAHQLMKGWTWWSLHTTGYYSAIKRRDSDTHYNMDEPQRHGAERQKPVTKALLRDSIYLKCPE